MKQIEKHETNRNSQLTPVTSPHGTWSLEVERGASGASTFRSRARIYRDFHPANTFGDGRCPLLNNLSAHSHFLRLRPWLPVELVRVSLLLR